VEGENESVGLGCENEMLLGCKKDETADR